MVGPFMPHHFHPFLLGETNFCTSIFSTNLYSEAAEGTRRQPLRQSRKFCHQDYPEYEVIFSLQNENDPACKVARMIKNKYRDRDITVHVERCSAGLNPKVNNLIPAYRIAKHPYILISDSNVMAVRIIWLT